MSNRLNIVCLGSCDMYPTYGFVGGFREAGAKVISYGESANNAYSVLYHLERKENQKSFQNADLITLGFIDNHLLEEHLVPIYQIIYKKLWKLNKKILICIWSNAALNNKILKFYLMQFEYYGFNVVDMRNYCKEKEILEFYTSYQDWGHPFYSFMSGISKRIIKEFDKLQYPKKIDNVVDEVEFKIVPFAEFMDEKSIQKTRTFTQYENICKLENNQEIKIPSDCKGYTLIGIHMMNRVANKFIAPKYHTTFTLRNTTKEVLIYTYSYNYVTPIRTNDFIVDNETYLKRTFDDTIEKLQPILSTKYC